MSGTPTGSTPLTPLTLDVTATDGNGDSVTQDYAIRIYYTPQQIEQAYGINMVTLSGGIIGDGAGQTIAIIDANDAANLVSTNDPNFLYSDLHQFDVMMGLPDPPEFLKLDAFGGINYPAPPSGGDQGETTQDVEWAHALAPAANIILFEANDLFPSTLDAIQTARSYPGVSVVSMSYYKFTEIDTAAAANVNIEPPLDAAFVSPSDHPMTFVAAAGDYLHMSYETRYAAVSPDMLSVGYTGLTLDAAGIGYGEEAAVYGAGGGTSLQELQPSWQPVYGVTTTPAAPTMRTTPDVTFNGSISTAVAVYDSANSATGEPWKSGNGTSIATPSWAALLAIVNQGRALVGLAPLNGATETLPDLYSLAGTQDFHDISVVAGLSSGASSDPSTLIADGTVISPAFGPYNPWSGLGSPVVNLLIPDMVGGQNTISGTITNAMTGAGLAGWTVFLDVNNNERRRSARCRG